MKIILKIFLILFLVLTSCGKEIKEEKKLPVKDSLDLVLDNTIEPVGGMSALIKNVKYPAEAKKDGLQGKVFIKAFIDQNGNVYKTEILKSTNSVLDTAAENALRKTKFTIPVSKGKPVKTSVVVPVMFRLK